MAYELSFEELEERAAEVGLLFLSATNQIELPEVEKERLSQWQNSGYGGEMEYMLRAPEERTNGAALVEGTSLILIFAIPYRAHPRPELPLGHGRVARYALGRDYHRVIKRRLEKLRALIGDSPSLLWRPITDSFPLFERAFAASSGLGFVGKNTMLLRHKLGSYFFLGEVLTNLELKERKSLKIYDGTCGTCTNCLQNCPTNAFPKPYVLDAKRCISYLTIEKRTPFSEWESGALGEWVFGCDICQEVCPFNHSRAAEDTFTVWEEFEGKVPQTLELAPLFELRSEEDFVNLFAGSPLLRAGREGLLRNALAVIANTGAEEVFNNIADLVSQDSSEMVKEEAKRAERKLSRLPLQR